MKAAASLTIPYMSFFVAGTNANFSNSNPISTRISAYMHATTG